MKSTRKSGAQRQDEFRQRHFAAGRTKRLNNYITPDEFELMTAYLKELRGGHKPADVFTEETGTC